MKRTKFVLSFGILVALLVGLTSVVMAAAPSDELADLCKELYEDTFGIPNSEPLGPCQWDMALINATDAGSYALTRGAGVRVGVLDSGVDFNHPDIAPNLNIDLSCSFIYSDTPLANPQEIANGDCSNKLAVQDLGGHGTHVASSIAAPINGIGIAGVAPEAEIVAIKVCVYVGYCFADSVAAGIRYAGDIGLDIVNLSLYADPYLYYCKSNAEQRAILREIEEAARYARQKGVLIVTSAGNGASDLTHPGIDDSSPNYPPGNEEVRDVQNNCRVAPTELPGALTVSSTGPIGIPGYDFRLADYSDVGMAVVNVAAPGGDYFAATGTVQDAIIGAALINDLRGTWAFYEFLESVAYPGLTSLDQGAGYIYLNGTSMSSPHAAGVAALVKSNHPGWGPDAIKAAVERSATPEECVDDALLPEGDARERCYGQGLGRNSFFGHGLVDALAAAQE